MTFRQIIAVLWQRKWLIVAVIVVALVVAGAYLALQVSSYSSTVLARTSVTVTNGASGGELDGVQVDFDPTTLTSPKVMQQVAKDTGSTETDIAKSITYTVQENKTTNSIEITAIGPTAKAAQDRSAATVKVYSTYLQGQINNALATLTKRQTDTNALAVQYEAEVNANPRNSIALANLNNALADLATLNTNIESLTNAGSPLTLLTDAPLGSPVGPGTAAVLGIALAAGLIAGIGIALIRDQFDDRLRGEFEIEPLTELPSLGELAFDKTLRRKRERLPAASREQSQLSEGLRSLRTSMQVLLPRKSAVVVLTSVEPADGKTFIAANLGLAWARTGKRVIVVGGDLRRPTLSTYFGEPVYAPGLSEILREASEPDAKSISEQLDARLVNTEFVGLRVLPSGFEASDPADLLATSSLRNVIAALRERADIVIIDSPPAMALIDASLLAEHSDGIIVIASVGRTDRAALVSTVDILRQNGAVTLGVIANRSKRRLPKTYAPYYIQPSSTRQTPSGGRANEAATTDELEWPLRASATGDSDDDRSARDTERLVPAPDEREEPDEIDELDEADEIDELDEADEIDEAVDEDEADDIDEADDVDELDAPDESEEPDNSVVRLVSDAGAARSDSSRRKTARSTSRSATTRTVSDLPAE